MAQKDPKRSSAQPIVDAPQNQDRYSNLFGGKHVTEGKSVLFELFPYPSNEDVAYIASLLAHTSSPDISYKDRSFTREEVFNWLKHTASRNPVISRAITDNINDLDLLDLIEKAFLGDVNVKSIAPEKLEELVQIHQQELAEQAKLHEKTSGLPSTQQQIENAQRIARENALFKSKHVKPIQNILINQEMSTFRAHSAQELEVKRLEVEHTTETVVSNALNSIVNGTQEKLDDRTIIAIAKEAVRDNGFGNQNQIARTLAIELKNYQPVVTGYLQSTATIVRDLEAQGVDRSEAKQITNQIVRKLTQVPDAQLDQTIIQQLISTSVTQSRAASIATYVQTISNSTPDDIRKEIELKISETLEGIDLDQRQKISSQLFKKISQHEDRSIENISKLIQNHLQPIANKLATDTGLVENVIRSKKTAEAFQQLQTGIETQAEVLNSTELINRYVANGLTQSEALKAVEVHLGLDRRLNSMTRFVIAGKTANKEFQTYLENHGSYVDILKDSEALSAGDRHRQGLFLKQGGNTHLVISNVALNNDTHSLEEIRTEVQSLLRKNGSDKLVSDQETILALFSDKAFKEIIKNSNIRHIERVRLDMSQAFELRKYLLEHKDQVPPWLHSMFENRNLLNLDHESAGFFLTRPDGAPQIHGLQSYAARVLTKVRARISLPGSAIRTRFNFVNSWGNRIHTGIGSIRTRFANWWGGVKSGFINRMNVWAGMGGVKGYIGGMVTGLLGKLGAKGAIGGLISNLKSKFFASALGKLASGAAIKVAGLAAGPVGWVITIGSLIGWDKLAKAAGALLFTPLMWALTLAKGLSSALSIFAPKAGAATGEIVRNASGTNTITGTGSGGGGSSLGGAALNFSVANAPIIAITATAIAGIFSIQTLTAAFVLPPYEYSNQTGNELFLPNTATTYTCPSNFQAPPGYPQGLPFTISGASITSGTGRYPAGSRLSGSHGNSIDFGLATGTPIVSTVAGKVIFAGWSNLGYGNLVQVQSSEGGFVVYFAHLLSNFAVKTGGSVSKGQIVGYSNNTGNSTGPHLHYQLQLSGADPSLNNLSIACGTGLSPAQIANINLSCDKSCGTTP